MPGSSRRQPSQPTLALEDEVILGGLSRRLRPRCQAEGEQNPGADAERRTDLEDAQHVMEACGAAQVEDQQQRTDERRDQRDVARPPHRRAVTPPAEEVGQPANQRDPAAQPANEDVKRDIPLPCRLS